MPVRNCRLGPWRLEEWLQSRVVQEIEIACYENLKFNDDGGAPLGKFGDEWVRTSRRTILMCNLLHFQPIKFPLRAMRHNVSRLKTVYKSKLVDWHLDEEIHLVVLEKKMSSVQRSTIHVQFLLVISAYQLFIERMEAHDMKNESLFAKIQFSNETLI